VLSVGSGNSSLSWDRNEDFGIAFERRGCVQWLCVMRPEDSRPDRAPVIFYAGFIVAIAVVVLVGAYAFTGDLSGLKSVGGPGR
jgi:hypothetical protein